MNPEDEDITLENIEVGQTEMPDDMSMNGVAVPPAPPVEYRDFGLDTKAIRGHIFNADDIKEELMDIPEWRTKVLLRGLTGRQRSMVMKAMMGANMEPDVDKMYSMMVVFGVRNPNNGELVFSPADRENLMMQKSAGVIERISIAVSKLSGLEQATQVQMAKN